MIFGIGGTLGKDIIGEVDIELGNTRDLRLGTTKPLELEPPLVWANGKEDWTKEDKDFINFKGKKHMTLT